MSKEKLYELIESHKVDEVDSILRDDRELAHEVFMDGKGGKLSIYHLSALLNSTKLFEIGLQHGVAFNETLDNWTSAHYCAANDSLDVLNLLIEHNQPVNNKDDRGKTPFYWAVLRKHFQIADLLLAQGVDVNVTYKIDTPIPLLHHEAKDGKVQGLEYLLKNGANPNLQTSFEDSLDAALHWACKKGKHKSVELLMKYGADKNLKNNAGQTPVDLATDESIISLFKK